MHYKTVAVQKIANEFGWLFHSEYPFLDADYSPSTQMPAMDLTLDVAELYANGDVAALRELWSYIGDTTETVLLERCFKVRRPSGLEISDFGWNEIWAINALMTRMGSIHGGNHASMAAASLLATTLSTRNVGYDFKLKSWLMDSMGNELAARKNAGLINDDIQKIISEATCSFEQDVAEFCDFANIMKTIYPTIRVAFAGLCFGVGESEWSRKIHWDLGYGERCYGCSGRLNREIGESLELLEPYDPNEFGVPRSITKPILIDELAKCGVPCKKTAKRDDLLRLAQQQPGMILSLLNKYEHELRTVKEEYACSARAWASRNGKLFFLAMALLSFIQAQMYLES